MQIIFFTRLCKGGRGVNLCQPLFILLGVSFFIATLAGSNYLGRQSGYHAVTEVHDKKILKNISQLKAELIKQKLIVEATKLTAQSNIDALTKKTAILQAHVFRLNALGKRLVSLSNMLDGEFDFENMPALGGPIENSVLVSEQNLGVLDHDLDKIIDEIKEKERQLLGIESILQNKHLGNEFYPTGSPVKEGWVSSSYGMRIDPINGKKAHHKGMDFAGKKGIDVMTVAAGVVTWEGPRYGYGNMVEISHGNYLVTRYGHNSKNLVVVGQKVKKGQVIALLGSTGRSTGPHVHFEILKNGRAINPKKYVNLKDI